MATAPNKSGQTVGQTVGQTTGLTTDAETTHSVSLLGCGWLGVALAQSLLSLGFLVRGSTTRSSRMASLRSIGIEPFLLRVEPQSRSDSDLQTANPSSSAFLSSRCLVIDLPPDTAMGSDYHPSQVQSIISMLRLLTELPAQIVYVSSSSVYGAGQGVVDETTRPEPDPGSGEVLLATENILRDYAQRSSIGLTIVRPAGFIGPGRHPGLFLAGRTGVANGLNPVNLIHQLDLCEWLVALIAEHPVRHGECEVYNAASNHHPLRSEYYLRASQAIGVVPPTFKPEGGRSDSKIVSSEKIRKKTGREARHDDLFKAIGVTGPQ